MRALPTLLAAAALAAVPAAHAGTSGPKLRVVSAAPLVVVGAGFVPRERVVVSATTSLGTRAVRVQASARGTFGARFAPFTQPCGKPFAVRARGLTSRRAGLARGSATPCVPPPID